MNTRLTASNSTTEERVNAFKLKGQSQVLATNQRMAADIQEAYRWSGLSPEALSLQYQHYRTRVNNQGYIGDFNSHVLEYVKKGKEQPYANQTPQNPVKPYANQAAGGIVDPAAVERKRQAEQAAFEAQAAAAKPKP